MNVIKKHPKGLYLLFCTEMWERFSYYGMRALLLLYMVEVLKYSNSLAGNIYGLYTGFVYFTPIIGGYIADKILGQRKCISIGAILMIIGLLLLSVKNQMSFFSGLSLMVVANGFFKANISSILGLLYDANDKSMKDSGFTIFYMGINLGALFSPLVCGTVAIKYGYNYGFICAGIGMLIGLCSYKLFENKLLGEIGKFTPKEKLQTKEDVDTKITKEQIKKIVCLFVLMSFTIIFWICFEQAGSSLTLFAQMSTNRNLLNHTVPTGYFQSLNPLFIISLAPIFSIIWEKLKIKGKEPNSIQKFTLAMFLMSFSYIIMSLAGKISETHLVSIFWLIITYFIMTLSELCISPIGLSLVTKLAPKRFLSILMGTWFLTSFFGNIIAGWWGGKFGTISTFHLYLTLSVISLMSGILLLLLTPKLNQYIKNE